MQALPQVGMGRPSPQPGFTLGCLEQGFGEDLGAEGS